MGNILNLEKGGVKYLPHRKQIFDEVDIDFPFGSLVGVTGVSGSGKSTLGRFLAGLLTLNRGWEVKGKLNWGNFKGQTLKKVGVVFQNTTPQFFTNTVYDELRLILGKEDIIEGVLEKWNMRHLCKRRISLLSSGEKEFLAIVSILYRSPDLIILDEPGANLDSNRKDLLKKYLTEWLNEKPRAALILEHDQELLSICSINYRLEKGSVYKDTLPQNELNPLLDLKSEFGPYKPDKNAPEVLDVKNLRYPRVGGTLALAVNFILKEREIVGLAGQNGSGKSTLLALLSGVLELEEGEIRWKGNLWKNSRQRVGYCSLLLQDPLKQLFCTTVSEEILQVLKNWDKDTDETLQGILKDYDLSELACYPPLKLSYGEQQRLALASSLAFCPPLILLDEPTHGMDIHHLRMFCLSLAKFRRQGGTVLIASHDHRLLNVVCDRVIYMENL